ncbi:hypothetical protein ABTY53_32895 [Streptomyces noursei]|uniref:hypothetical protein n=1 Tax=Streptomyces noursei TaxID=1971 RepID=UPI00332FBF06
MPGSTEGFSYIRDTDDEGRPRLRIGYGPVGARLLAGMRRAVAGLLSEGNNVIVDEVPIDATVVALLATQEAARPTITNRVTDIVPLRRLQ